MLPLVQTTCYKGLALPVFEYASPVQDPHQQDLINSLELVQRRVARRTLHDFRRSISATALVSGLDLDTLLLRRNCGQGHLEV